MEKFRRLNKPEIEELLEKTLFKTFFHSLTWHEFLEKEFKWLKFEYFLYKDKALLIFGRIETCLPAGRLISLPFCEYGGPLPLLVRRSPASPAGRLGEGGKEDIDINEFKRDVLSEFGENIKIKVHPEIKSGDSNSDVSTHWIENLQNISEQDLLASFRKTLRHEIRNAQERGLKIKRCETQQELKKFYDLYTANLRLKKTVPYPWPLIQFLYQNPSSELLLALYKGKIVGGALFLNYSHFVHYFLSATDHKYRNLGIAHLILWEKIKSLIGKDVVLDLGASPKGSALEIFKLGWGGKEYPIYQIGIKRSSERLRSSKLRNLFGLLPNCIIKKISPFLIKYRL